MFLLIKKEVIIIFIYKESSNALFKVLETLKYLEKNKWLIIKQYHSAEDLLSIKIKQSDDTDQYSLKNVWYFTMCTICINILTFLINCRVNIRTYIMSKINFIKTQLDNSGVISQNFIEYVEYKEIGNQNMFDFAVSLISLSRFSTIFISQTHNILRQGWIQLGRLKLLDNLNPVVRKLILGNIISVDETFGRKPHIESML